MQLRIPGPTPIPDEILQSMTKQMINHRGKEFGEIVGRITESLKRVFQTKNDVIVLTGSGTGGMEAAVVNTLSPGDQVLSVSIGVFGDRFASIAEQFGAKVKRIKFEWGTAADPDVIRKELKENLGIKAVLVTHNETSTGVTNDLAIISKVINEFDKLLLVDAISSVGSIDLPVDSWECDVVVSGSQKGWMVPPGLAMVSVSSKAWQANAQAKMPRYYWDFAKAKKILDEKKQTPWTPAVSLFYALDAALDRMEREGLPNIFTRHARVAKATRKGIKSLGLSLFPEEKVASNTVTSVNAPQGIEVKKLTRMLQEEHKVVLSGGQQSLEGKIFRIGHMGWVTESDIKEVLEALRVSLSKLR